MATTDVFDRLREWREQPFSRWEEFDLTPADVDAILALKALADRRGEVLREVLGQVEDDALWFLFPQRMLQRLAAWRTRAALTDDNPAG